MSSALNSTKAGFLDLPAELRYDIYRLALTNKTPLFAELNWPRGRVLLSASGSVNIDPTQEFNQLKYVCHQLNKETAGLELKYNDLEIRKLDRHYLNVGEMLSLFACHVGKSKKHWLDGIVFHLKDNSTVLRQPKDRISSHNTIVAFCTEHPLVTVHHTEPEWSIRLSRKYRNLTDIETGAIEFFLDGLGLAVVLHGLLPIPALTPMVLTSRTENVRPDEIIGPDEHRVSNFRIFPSNVEIERDERAILAAGLWLGRLGCHLGPRPNDLEAFARECLELFRGWVKHGV